MEDCHPNVFLAQYHYWYLYIGPRACQISENVQVQGTLYNTYQALS